eukprot:s2366_g16.t1
MAAMLIFRMPSAMVCLLLLVTLGIALGGSFPYPDPFEPPVVCDTCSGEGAALCKSQDCVARCSTPTNHCFKANRYKLGCCCDPARVPPPDTFKCRTGGKHNGTCLWECCKAVRYGDKTVSSTICGDGCCTPSNHGGQRQCGASWPMPVPNKKGMERRKCCLEKGAVQDHQNGARCCLHGDGVNCTSPGQDAPCCLLSSTTVLHNKSRSSDPHAPCQRNTCLAYIPCPAGSAGQGVTCGLHGAVFTSPNQQKVCCLKEAKPSANDPCQVNSEDCRLRYKPCHQADSLGTNCASPSGKSTCCLQEGREAGSCRRDCSSWQREQAERQTVVISIFVVGVGLCILLGLLFFKKLRGCYRHFLRRVDNGRGGSLLMASSEVTRVVPLRDHECRVLLSIACQRYVHYPPLTAPYGDASMLAAECQELGYDQVVKIHGETSADIRRGFCEALQIVAGTTDALLLVSFSGHAVEENGQMLWAPEDADPQDLSSHVNMAILCRDLMQAHLDRGMALFCPGMRPARGLFYVLLADCCRLPPPSENAHCAPLPRGLAELQRPRHRPKMYLMYACGPGRSATDTSPSGHSPLMTQVKEQLPTTQPVPSFAQSVDAGLKTATDHRQELWRYEVSGPFESVSLAPPMERLRSGSSSDTHVSQAI